MDKVQEFLNVAREFQLGHLTTESAHHLSRDLSVLVQQDIPEAIRVLQKVDQLALRTLEPAMPGIWRLHQKIQETWRQEGDVLLVGCGATGRLSLVLETLAHQQDRYPQRIRSFMAGGDYALIKSVESFEDRADYGIRQLHEMGFKDGDLLIAITEGGETPFVIGACLEAARVSRLAPWFVYCNPDSALERFERCRSVLHNPHIEKLNLTCGAMALTGSTRMQASTVQMAAVGLALLYDWPSQKVLSEAFERWREWMSGQDLVGLTELIKAEADTHGRGELTTYVSDENLAISILTDTTERSPTFSQPAFENILTSHGPSPIYLSVEGACDPLSAWQSLLGRSPRCLGWPELSGRVEERVLLGFDISREAISRRRGEQVHFRLFPGVIYWQSTQGPWAMPVWDEGGLFTHLALKMALNTLSTIVMGRRGFYLDNVMTWVRPSNNKLIDRATRYVQLLAQRRGQSLGYEELATRVIQEMGQESMEPVVLRVLAGLGLA